MNPDIYRPYLGFSNIIVNGRDGTSRYNSLQAFLNHRFTAGLEFQAAYTYSRLISDTVNRDSEAKDSPVYNVYNLKAEKALGTQDQPHAFVLNYIYELPFFRKSSNAFARQTLGGWVVAGAYSIRSGLPQAVCLDHDVTGLTDGGLICQRPDLVAPPNLDADKRTVQRFFNTDAFALQQPGTFGNSARNVVRGPGISNWDFSVFKNFSLPFKSGDRTSELQFRAEFFNFLNHTQFSGIDTTFTPESDTAGAHVSPDSPFGSVTSAYAPREIQLALKLIF